jgi:hypothetical protein
VVVEERDRFGELCTRPAVFSAALTLGNVSASINATSTGPAVSSSTTSGATYELRALNITHAEFRIRLELAATLRVKLGVNGNVLPVQISGVSVVDGASYSAAMSCVACRC